MTISRTEFLARRRSGIGGSDIAAICGLSPWRTAVDVYIDKTAEMPAEVDSMPVGAGSQLWWGSQLEATIGRAYALATGRRIRRCNVQLSHPEMPHLIGNVDFLCFCEDGRTPWTRSKGVRTTRAVEIKNVRYPSEQWGPDGSDEIPAYYQAQVQWYMGLMPTVEVVDLCALFGGSELRIYHIFRDDDVIGGLQTIGDRYWRDHVEQKNPPEAVTIDDVKRLFPAPAAKKIEATEEIRDAVDRLLRLQRVRLDLTAEEQILKDRIAVYMADAEILTDGERVLATFKTESRGRVFRAKK